MAKDINKEAFSKSTQLKLNIVSYFFKEWLPVFTYDTYSKELFIADFFAGSGKDAKGNYGSPMLLLEETTKNCKQIKSQNKEVKFVFNEKLKSKFKELKNNIDNYVDDCKERNNCNECIFKIEITNKDFQELFKSKYIIDIMNDKNIAKFLFLDQYGIKEIKKDIFNKLVNSYRTDFIFFISSSNVIRFKEMPEMQQYINLNNIEHNEKDYDKSHRVIVEYYKSLLPKDFDYYLHGFSLKKDSNFYGIIFGSGHTYGMEKFLKVC